MTDKEPEPTRFSSSTTGPAFGYDCGPSPDDWEQKRDSHTPPHTVSEYRVEQAHRDEFMLGLHVLGHEEPTPQQMVLSDVLNSTDLAGYPLYDQVAAQLPRRAGKSETLTAIALGRCLTRSGYLVAVFFNSTGTKVATRWRDDVFTALESWASAEFGDKDAWPFKITLSNGRESIHFDNGSRIHILPPKASSFRSEAYDLVISDEAGEASAAQTKTLVKAVLPTMSTRPHSQLVVAGTPASFRDGNWLWDALADGRSEDEPTAGLVDYSTGRDLTLEDVDEWEKVEPLLLTVHPGIGTLTTLAKLRKDYKMGPLEFASEYLGWFQPDTSVSGALNAGKWEEGEVTFSGELLDQLPARFALGFAVHHAASVCAVWRDADGIAYVMLLANKVGNADWLADLLRTKAAEFPGVPMAHDDRGPVMVTVEELRHTRPVPNLKIQRTANVSTAAALFQRELHIGKLRHFGQRELTQSAMSASRRDFPGGKAWGFGRLTEAADITPMEAASMALRVWDELPVQQELPGFMRAS